MRPEPATACSIERLLNRRAVGSGWWTGAMPKHNQIDLVEFPAADPAVLAKARAFYEKAFDWSFTAYGPTSTRATAGR